MSGCGPDSNGMGGAKLSPKEQRALLARRDARARRLAAIRTCQYVPERDVGLFVRAWRAIRKSRSS